MGDYILFSFIPNKSKVFGFFDEDDGNIYINEKLGKITKEIIFVHESKHRSCFNNKCKCWKKKTEFWCEYHAFRAEFFFILHKNTKKYWIVYFKGIIEDLEKFKNDNAKSWKSHFQALHKVCRFKKFVENAKKYNYYKKIKKMLRDK